MQIHLFLGALAGCGTKDSTPTSTDDSETSVEPVDTTDTGHSTTTPTTPTTPPPIPDPVEITATIQLSSLTDHVLRDSDGVADPEFVMVGDELLMNYVRNGRGWVAEMNPTTGQFVNRRDLASTLLALPTVRLTHPWFNGPEFGLAGDRVFLYSIQGDTKHSRIEVTEIGHGGQLSVIASETVADPAAVPIGTIDPNISTSWMLYGVTVEPPELYAAEVVDTKAGGFELRDPILISDRVGSGEGTARWAVGPDGERGPTMTAFTVVDHQDRLQAAVWDRASGQLTVVSAYEGERVDEAWLLLDAEGSPTLWCTVDERRFDIYERQDQDWVRTRIVHMPPLTDGKVTYQWILSPEVVRLDGRDYVLLEYSDLPATADNGEALILLLRFDTGEAVSVSGSRILARRDPEAVITPNGLLVYYTSHDPRFTRARNFVSPIDALTLLPDP